MPAHENILAHLGGQPLFFRPGDEMVDEDPDTTMRRGTELRQRRVQIVETIETFDDNALRAQVGTPYPFEERGIVYALHEDAARPCLPCTLVWHDA